MHSLTSQLILSAFHATGGARRGCVARVKGVLGCVKGMLRVCRSFSCDKTRLKLS